MAGSVNKVILVGRLGAENPLLGRQRWKNTLGNGDSWAGHSDTGF